MVSRVCAQLYVLCVHSAHNSECIFLCICQLVKLLKKRDCESKAFTDGSVRYNQLNNRKTSGLFIYTETFNYTFPHLMNEIIVEYQHTEKSVAESNLTRTNTSFKMLSHCLRD